MNPERPDNPENPDEGAEPDATEELRAAGDEAAEASEAAETSEAPAAPEADGTGKAEKGEEAEKAGKADVADQPEPPEPTDHAEPTGTPPAPPRRPRSRLVVASVAAAVLVVGGGGALLASTSSVGGSGGSGGTGGGTGSPGGDGTPPPLVLDGYTGGGPNGIAPGEPDPHGVTYRADGDLPDGPDSAAVHMVRGEVTAAEVTRLAKALGVAGTPTAEGGSWLVGAAGDGSGPALRVNKQAPGTWTFNRYAPGTDDCQKAGACTTGGTAEGGGDPVGEAFARKAAAPVLKAVGQDDAKLDAGQLMGAVRVVNADPEVGGLPTYGWSTGVQIGADGTVVGGTGNLKAPVKSDTYPVVDAERALKLLNGSGQGLGTERGGIGGCTGPVPLEGENRTVTADETPCERMTALPKPEPVTVDNAVFGLAPHTVDGRPALVPSWMFEVRPTGAGDSYTVTHPAVDPAYLAAPEPSAEPTERRPGDPGASREVKVQGYTVDGNELTVSFWGGVCSAYGASVREESGEVRVTVTDTPQEGKVCIMIAKVVERTVSLDEPLGDRKVVGSDGETIPEGGIAELQPK